ncbi:MAG: hypothetical protein R2849_15210 [Thermomicrobiales bacterium]
MVDIADDHIELDISRARDLLGWEPQHFVLDSVPNMIDELRRDPAAWYERHDPGQRRRQRFRNGRYSRSSFFREYSGNTTGRALRARPFVMRSIWKKGISDGLVSRTETRA